MVPGTIFYNFGNIPLDIFPTIVYAYYGGKKMKKPKKEHIKINNENFKPIEIKQVDSKNRINLGEKVIKFVSDITQGADAYQVCVGSNGDVLLRPVVSIPSSEAWIYHNPKVKKLIRNGLDEANKGDIEKADDLDKYFDNL